MSSCEQSHCVQMNPSQILLHLHTKNAKFIFKVNIIFTLFLIYLPKMHLKFFVSIIVLQILHNSCYVHENVSHLLWSLIIN